MEKDKGKHKHESKKAEPKVQKKEETHDKCLHCGGKLVMSRDTLMKARSVWWQKPWGSVLSMDEPVVSYACMKCGNVFFLLRNRHRIVREYEQLSEDQKKIVER